MKLKIPRGLIVLFIVIFAIYAFFFSIDLFTYVQAQSALSYIHNFYDDNQYFPSQVEFFEKYNNPGFRYGYRAKRQSIADDENRYKSYSFEYRVLVKRPFFQGRYERKSGFGEDGNRYEVNSCMTHIYCNHREPSTMRFYNRYKPRFAYGEPDPNYIADFAWDTGSFDFKTHEKVAFQILPYSKNFSRISWKPINKHDHVDWEYFSFDYVDEEYFGIKKDEFSDDVPRSNLNPPFSYNSSKMYLINGNKSGKTILDITYGICPEQDSSHPDCRLESKRLYVEFYK